MSPYIRRFAVLFLLALFSIAACSSSRADDSPVVPTEITIKLGDVKLFPVNSQGKVLLTNSDSCRCGAYLLGETGTNNGVLFIPHVAGNKPIEITVASGKSLDVYRITVSATDPSTSSTLETKLQEVTLQPGESKVYEFKTSGPVSTLVTHSYAVSTCLLGDEQTQRGMRVEGLAKGHNYVTVAAGTKDLKLFKFVVK